MRTCKNGAGALRPRKLHTTPWVHLVTLERDPVVVEADDGHGVSAPAKASSADDKALLIYISGTVAMLRTDFLPSFPKV